MNYDYRIGTYEVTISQYATFLNSVAASDPYSMWNSNMETNLNIAGILRSGISGSYSYSVIGSGDRPITYVSWFDAARFTNWLHNGATASADTEFGAYTLNGATSGIITKNSGAQWWIPSEDEWVKAAYYNPATGNYSRHANQTNSMTTNTIGATGGANYNDGDYATTQSSSFPTGNALTDAGAYDTQSYYGTYDQGGNVWEWNDAVNAGSSRGRRGGSWGSGESGLTASTRVFDPPEFGNSSFLGFRVAAVPEPSTAVLMLMGGAAWLLKKRRRA